MTSSPSRILHPPLTLSGAVLVPASDTYTADLPRGTRPLSGHYPGYPIVPGVFVAEIVAAAEADHQGLAHPLEQWCGLRAVRFRAPVFPGQRVHLNRSERPTGPRWTVSHADGTEVATVDLRMDLDRRTKTVGPSGGGTAQLRTVGVAPQQVIPHRPPMLLVDQVLALTPGVDARVQYTATAGAGGSDLGQDTPVPWPLVVESWGQAAALLATWGEPSPDVHTGNVLLFGGAREIRFGAQPLPGARLEHRVELVADAGGAAVLTGTACVGETQVLDVGQVTIGRRPPGSLPRPPADPSTAAEEDHHG